MNESAETKPIRAESMSEAVRRSIIERLTTVEVQAAETDVTSAIDPTTIGLTPGETILLRNAVRERATLTEAQELERPAANLRLAQTRSALDDLESGEPASFPTDLPVTAVWPIELIPLAFMSAAEVVALEGPTATLLSADSGSRESYLVVLVIVSVAAISAHYAAESIVKSRSAKTGLQRTQNRKSTIARGTPLALVGAFAVLARVFAINLSSSSSAASTQFDFAGFAGSAVFQLVFVLGALGLTMGLATRREAADQLRRSVYKTRLESEELALEDQLGNLVEIHNRQAHSLEEEFRGSFLEHPRRVAVLHDDDYAQVLWLRRQVQATEIEEPAPSQLPKSGPIAPPRTAPVTPFAEAEDEVIDLRTPGDGVIDLRMSADEPNGLSDAHAKEIQVDEDPDLDLFDAIVGD